MLVLSLQYLRGLAALMVLMDHIGQKSAQQSADVLSGWHVGGAGVDLFFIISGFIMCHTTAHKHQTVGATRQFIIRRLFRIIPLYWLVTCLALAVYIVMPSQMNNGEGADLIASYLLLPSKQSYLVANGWTLRFEFLFYLVFMLGFFFSRYIGHIVVVTLLFALVGFGIWKPHTGVWSEFLTNPILVEFVFGMLLYHCFEKLKQQHTIILVGLIGTGIGSLWVVNQGMRSGVWALDYGVPMLLMMAGVLGFERALQSRPITLFKMLGDSSYAMYLIHPFALTGGAMVMTKLGLNQLLGGWLFAAALLLTSLLAGYGLYRWVELPITKRLKNAAWLTQPKHKTKQPLRGSI
ncbi:MAG: acyltransferase family protein [Leucothrix sp.]